MKRYEGMSDSVMLAVDAGLTWPIIVSNFLIDPPSKPENYNTSRRLDKFHVQPQQKKKPKSAHPATLESMTIKQLKDILTNLSLPLIGSKQVLIDRIASNRPIPPSIKNPQLLSNSKSISKTGDNPSKSISKTQKSIPKSSIKQSTRKRGNENRNNQPNKKARKEINTLNAETSRLLSQSNLNKKRNIKPNSKYNSLFI
jgi:hypothetical protein